MQRRLVAKLVRSVDSEKEGTKSHTSRYNFTKWVEPDIEIVVDHNRFQAGTSEPPSANAPKTTDTKKAKPIKYKK